MLGKRKKSHKYLTILNPFGTSQHRQKFKIKQRKCKMHLGFDNLKKSILLQSINWNIVGKTNYLNYLLDVI